MELRQVCNERDLLDLCDDPPARGPARHPQITFLSGPPYPLLPPNFAGESGAGAAAPPGAPSVPLVGLLHDGQPVHRHLGGAGSLGGRGGISCRPLQMVSPLGQAEWPSFLGDLGVRLHGKGLLEAASPAGLGQVHKVQEDIDRV